MDIGFNDMRLDISSIIIFGFVILAFVLSVRRRSFSYFLCLSTFLIYIFFAMEKTLFPIFISGDLAEGRRQLSFMIGVNFIPLYFGRTLDTENIILGLAQNIILTIPLGFGINFILEIKRRHLAWLLILGSLGFEIAQLVISLLIQYPYRIIDINDAICNLLGVLIGYGVFMVFAYIYLNATQRFGIKHDGLSAYIYNVVYQAQNIDKAKNTKHRLLADVLPHSD